MGQKSYEILPRLPVLIQGTLLKNKETLVGTNAAGVNRADENYEYGNEEIEIPRDSILFFVENKQFMANSETKPMSAWIRCHFIVDEKIVWVTLLCEQQRIWDFETFRGKSRMIENKTNELFEILQEGNSDTK